MPETVPKLEWTGERFLPWIDNAALAYEHLHRYAFAARFAEGKHVLDLGAGEGYGSNILAQTAAAVLAVDSDTASVQHAAARYVRQNLAFSVGTFDRVPVAADHTFDLVVCFEAIEHYDDHDALLGEVKRLLKPEGLFIVSTPDKSAYRDTPGEENPFHVHELEREEFRQLLHRYFSESRMFGQRIHPASSIWPLESGRPDAVENLRIARGADEFAFSATETQPPLYLIALASDVATAMVPVGSVMLDSSDELFHETDRTIRELLRSKEAIDALAHLRKEADWHLEQIGEIRGAVRKAFQDNQETQALLNRTRAELEAIYRSSGWRLLQRVGRIMKTVTGR